MLSAGLPLQAQQAMSQILMVLDRLLQWGMVFCLRCFEKKTVQSPCFKAIYYVKGQETIIVFYFEPTKNSKMCVVYCFSFCAL